MSESIYDRLNKYKYKPKSSEEGATVPSSTTAVDGGGTNQDNNISARLDKYKFKPTSTSASAPVPTAASPYTISAPTIAAKPVTYNPTSYATLAPDASVPSLYPTSKFWIKQEEQDRLEELRAAAQKESDLFNGQLGDTRIGDFGFTAKDVYNFLGKNVGTPAKIELAEYEKQVAENEAARIQSYLDNYVIPGVNDAATLAKIEEQRKKEKEAYEAKKAELKAAADAELQAKMNPTNVISNAMATSGMNPWLASLLQTKDSPAMLEYEKFIAAEMEAQNKEIQEAFKKWANQNVGTKVAASAASLATSPLSGLDYLNKLGQKAIVGETLPSNVPDFTQMTQSLREGVSEDWNGVGKFIYNTGMSAGDSLIANTIGNLFLPGSGIGGAIILGTSSAASTANDIKERGGTDEQALIGGAVSGVFEAMFEKVSLGNFEALKEAHATAVKEIIKNTAKSVVVNASEEGLTEFANIMYDYLANGELSNYQQMVKGFVEQGISEESARILAKAQLMQQIEESALSGALMGIFFGATGSVSSYNKNVKTGKQITANNAQQEVIDYALSFPKRTDTYQMAVSLQNKRGGVTTADIGSLARMIDIDTRNGERPNKIVSKSETTTENAETQAAAETIELSATAQAFVDAGDSVEVAEKKAAILDRVVAGDTTLSNSNLRDLKMDSPSTRQVFEQITGVAVPDTHATQDLLRTARGVIESVNATTNTLTAEDVSNAAPQTEAAPVTAMETQQTAPVVETAHVAEAARVAPAAEVEQAASVAAQNAPAVAREAAQAAPAAEVEQTSPVAQTAAQNAPAAQQSGYTYSGKSVVVRDDNFKKANLSNRQVRLYDAIAKTLGVDIRFVDRIVDDDGNEANGQYKDRVITLALNADDPATTTVVHEAIHRIKEASPDAYKALHDFVQQNMSGDLYETNIATREVLYGTSDRTELSEEIVADAFGRMMDDKALARTFAQENRSAWDTIRDTITDIIDSIKRVLRGESRNEKKLDQAQIDAFEDLLVNLEGLRNVFDEAVRGVGVGIENGAARAYNNSTEVKRSAKEGSRSINERGVDDERKNGDDLHKRVSSPVRGEQGLGGVGTQRKAEADVSGQRNLEGDSGKTAFSQDSEGRNLTEEQATLLDGTKVVDENGHPLALYHFTPEMDFDTFEKGDIGFHFGTVEQARNRGTKKNAEHGRMFRAYLAIKDPYRVHLDLNAWRPANIAVYLYSKDLITEDQWNEILNLNGDGYDSPGAKRLREILDDIGVDGFVYPNNVEGEGDSYIALRDDQIVRSDISEVDISDMTETEDDGATVATNRNGEPVAMTQPNGSARFSLKTYKDDGRQYLNNWLAKQVKAKAITQADADDITSKMDELFDICKQYEGKYAPFGAWSNASVVVDAKGNPVFSVVKANGEYAMNLDFSLVCKKRRTLDAVFGEMIRRGMMDNVMLEEADIAKINDIIRENGFETACALCFVDSKRYRQGKVADAFVSRYNELVNLLIPDGSDIKAAHFDFVGTGLYSDNGTALHTVPTSELNTAALKKVMNENGSKTVPHKIAKHLLNNPKDRRLLTRGEFMNTDGFEAVKVKNPAIMKLYNSSKGSGGPKAAFSDVQYLNDILKKSNFSAEKAYKVGGVRIQSFSDYVPRMVFDYIQMMGDLAAKKLPAHAYTKEAAFAKQFGLTGVKINLSLVPAVDPDGIAPGLDANGDYVWFDGQSFGSDVNVEGSGKTGFDLAVEIQNAEGYSANCGTIAVGISDQHIEKLLSDPDIRMVIPYHKSSLNHIVAVMNNIDKYEDYTGVQNTRYKISGSKIEGKDFNFNEALRRTGDAKTAADEYLAWCEENGYLPKFDQFADHENYYKLLEDFSTYDNGKVAPQGAVTMTFPTDGDAFGSMSQLIKEGLEEDAELEGRRERDVPGIVDQIETVMKADGKLSRKENRNAAVEQELTKIFGTTTNFAEAGFVLSNGDMIRMTDDDHAGERIYDHRAIGLAHGLDIDLNVNHGFNGESSKLLDEFVENGGIRFDAGEPSLGTDIGLQLSSNVPLTREQEQIIRDLVEWKRDRELEFESQMTEEDFLYTGPLAIRIDFGGDSEYAVGSSSAEDLAAWGKKSLEYNGRNISADRIINDIRHYYNTGEVREPSVASQFRYSRSTKEADRRVAEIARLKRENQRLREEMKLSHGKLTDEMGVRRIAREIRTEYGSKIQLSKFTDRLNDLYNMIAGGDAIYDDVYAEAKKIAADVIEGAVELQEFDEFGEIMGKLKGRKIYFEPEMRSDLESEGGYGAIRKRNISRFKLSSDASDTPIDVVYDELSDSFGSLFPDDIINPADQLLRIVEVLDNLSPIENNPFADDMDRATEFLAADILDRYFDAPQRSTFADKQARKLNEQKVKSAQDAEQRKADIEEARLAGQMAQGKAMAKQLSEKERQLAELRQKKNARIDTLKEASSKKVKNLRETMRKDRDERIKNLKQKYTKREESLRDNRNAAKFREKILRHTKDLSRKLTRPTDTQHIPELLRGPVAAMLDSINLESKYENVVGEGGKRKRVDAGSVEGATPTKRTEAFRALKAAYEEILKNEHMVLDPDLLDNLNAVAAMSNIRIADMDGKQLSTVWKCIRAVEKSITNANKMLANSKYKTLSDLAYDILRENRGKKQRTSFVGVAAKIDGLLDADMTTPLTWFYQLGKPGNEMFRMLRRAQDKQIDILSEAVGKSGAMLERKDTGVHKTNKVLSFEKKQKSFELSSGETITLTTAQIMELYALSYREQALKHIYGSGIRPNSVVKKGIVEKRRAEPYKVTEADVAQITSSLTDEQRKIVDSMRNYLSNELAEYGNETSLEVYGYRKFVEKNYWPIHVIKSQTRSDVASEAVAKTIPGYGMGKTTNPDASNALELNSVFDTYTDHIQQMATYSAWLGTSETMSRLRNFRFYDSDGNLDITMKTLFEKVYGTKGDRYFERLLEDIASGTKAKTDVETDTNPLAGNFKSSAVGFNTRVVLQQPTSILRATSMINIKYLMSPTLRRDTWDTAKKYAPIAQWKDWGYFEINNGRNVKDIILGSDALIEKIKQKGMAMAGAADSVTWSWLWGACESEVSEKHPELSGESFYRSVGERFSEIIDATQVVDSVLHRSQAMRSNRQLTKMATSFMSEPTSIYNQLYRAAYDVNGKTGDARKQAIKGVAAVCLAQGLSFFFNAIAQSIPDAGRDDDREKDYWEKFFEKMFGFTGEEETFGDYWTSFWDGNLQQNFNPIGYIPFLKDIQSLWEGYSVDRQDMEGIAKVVSALKALGKSVEGNGKHTTHVATINFASEILGALFGIPAANAVREVRSLVYTVVNGNGNLLMQYSVDKFFYNPVEESKRFYDLLYKASVEDPEAYEIMYADLMDSGLTPEKIETAMKKRYKDSKEEGYLAVPEIYRDISAGFDVVEKEDTGHKFDLDELSNEQQKTYYDTREDLYTDLINGDSAQMAMDKMADDYIEDMTNKLYKYANEQAKDAADPEYEITTKWINSASGGEKSGVDPTEVILFSVAYESVDGKDEDGNVVPGLKKKRTLELARKWMPWLSQQELDYLCEMYWKK